MGFLCCLFLLWDKDSNSSCHLLILACMYLGNDMWLLILLLLPPPYWRLKPCTTMPKFWGERENPEPHGATEALYWLYYVSGPSININKWKLGFRISKPYRYMKEYKISRDTQGGKKHRGNKYKLHFIGNDSNKVKSF